MERRKIDINGYDIVARMACDHGSVLVLNNNSDHYLVVEAEAEALADGLTDAGRIAKDRRREATHVASFRYGKGAPVRMVYRQALERAMEIALAHVSDEDIEACPGCGCRPGDGPTAGCDDDRGCGYFNDEAGR